MDHQYAYLSHPTHSGFCNAPALSQSADSPFCVAGVAYDGAVTNRPGARFGPAQIRLASHMLCDATHTLWQTTPQGLTADAGDLAFPNTSVYEMRACFEPQASALIAKHHMVWLGGDHSITLPLLRAYKKHFGKPLALLHFDAHCDTWSDHFSATTGHGTWTYEAHQEGLIDMTRTVQIGIRSAGLRKDIEYVSMHGGAIVTGRELRGLESTDQLRSVIELIRNRMLGDGVIPYLTLDIDCLDPAFAPGTGTPEPGGMTSNQVLSILEATADIPWCGMDICEVAPPYDHAQLTSNAAANFAWTYLCGAINRMNTQLPTQSK